MKSAHLGVDLRCTIRCILNHVADTVMMAVDTTGRSVGLRAEACDVLFSTPRIPSSSALICIRFDASQDVKLLRASG